jgi:hypothetical protein
MKYNILLKEKLTERQQRTQYASNLLRLAIFLVEISGSSKSTMMNATRLAVL